MSAPQTMAAKVRVYLAFRRKAGYALRIEGNQLANFAIFAEDQGHRGPLTVKLAMEWATASRRPGPLTAARRIEVLRPFARYCQQFDPDTEVPSHHLFGRSHRRLIPHIYTDAELEALLLACGDLFPKGGIRGAACATIFGLLASTGLRISEATGLRRSDVDLERCVLHIRHAKFGKSRLVPIHPTTADALRSYANRRDRDPLAAPTDAFFMFDYGHPASTAAVEYAFKLLRQRLRWRTRGGHKAPRIHDLRHSFICRRIEQWYLQGSNIDKHMLALSTFVGHAKVTDTYWYVTATPQLLALAAQRCQRDTGDKQ